MKPTKPKASRPKRATTNRREEVARRLAEVIALTDAGWNAAATCSRAKGVTVRTVNLHKAKAREQAAA